MCYYNGVKVSHSEFIRLKTLEKAIANYSFLSLPLHAGFDYRSVPVLKKIEGETDFDIVEMEWGFIPSYIKDREAAKLMRTGYKKPDGSGFQQPLTMLNAVSEELLLPRKVFRQSALHRRCLFLSTGFYEWQHVFPLNKKTGKPLKTAIKYPYRIGLKDREYFFMAGIYTPWTDHGTGEIVETAAIVTTKANSVMRQIHNSKLRMPTILTEDLAWEWLFGDLTEDRITEIAQYRLPSSQMDACTIVRDFRNSYDPTEKFEYEGLQPIDYDLPE